MDEGIDISDLLKVDDRIVASWRSAEVEEGILYLSFPNTGYEVDSISVEDGVMYIGLYIKESLSPRVAHVEVSVPEGVEKIVYDQIIKE